MILTYSRCSAPSAQAIADEDDSILINRGNVGTVNWGRANAKTKLNPDISNSTNKRVMRQLFREHGVPMPTYYGTNLSETGEDWHFPVVGRPDTHSRGRGFWLIKNFDDFRRALRGTRKKKAATHFFEYIDAPHELRVHIFLGKSIRISEKLAGSHGATAHGNYTTIKPTCPTKQARKAAKQAVAALGLDFGCVDILVKADGEPFVLEVNAAPGLGGTMPAVYCKAFLNWYNTTL